MSWFGFGFNGFGQIVSRREGENDGDNSKVLNPAVVVSLCSCESKARLSPKIKRTGSAERSSRIAATWSRRAAIHTHGDRHVCISGFTNDSGKDEECRGLQGCEDAVISERYLILSFADRVECWSLTPTGKALAWSRVWDTPKKTGAAVTLPLVPGGYIAPKPPFYRPLSAELCAVSLALGTEHAVLLTASGTVYTWGSGSHGQLGQGSVVSEDEPRAVEALWGVPMKHVSAGGWHSTCISAGGDLYVWGWNESGQIGLPSKGLKDESRSGQSTGQDALELTMSKEDDNVFISIQAFPALVDVPEMSEISKALEISTHGDGVTMASWVMVQNAVQMSLKLWSTSQIMECLWKMLFVGCGTHLYGLVQRIVPPHNPEVQDSDSY
ncbi:RCC1 domain-containing protein 1 isoform X2 [Salminus brasiliensis]|uniref:RCC1 domain-containing protein 1 isoform X2 n=1 Tax=Salminus brasiliensis TaxID=930266 RepID=UPI003B836001